MVVILFKEIWMKEIDLDTSTEELASLLGGLRLLHRGEVVRSTSKPGEGNMNIVLRVKTNHRDFILKQSRPYVNKYPSIPAPLDRIETERIFYRAMSTEESADRFPRVLGYSAEHHLLQLSDLGDCHDMSDMYNSGEHNSADIRRLCEILDTVHRCKADTSYPLNIALRELNHQHIFTLPFLQDNGFQLDDVQEGLQELSMAYKTDLRLHRIIDTIGQKYLSAGDTLLHGDYYPGSWMRSEEDVFILDPEFSFVGFREFDIGVMMAHLVLITDDINRMTEVASYYISAYDHKLAGQVAGIEIMRRLIGLAQLPLVRSLDEKKSLLEVAYDLIMKP